MGALCGVFAALAWAAPSESADSASTSAAAARSVTISRAAAAPLIDGILADEAWNEDARTPISDFHQQGPRYRESPTEKTIVKVTYDADNLYIAAKLFDSEPSKIRAAQLIQRGDISADDRFWCSLDTFNSKRNDYYFEVNANGVRGTALRENNSRFIPEWTAIWNAASRIDDDGWSTEMAIPFKSISFDSAGGPWRINCGRWIMRKQEHVILESTNRLWWAVDSREMSGIANVDRGLGLDIAASTTVAYRDDLKANWQQTQLQPTVDAFYRITPSLTAAVTLNSDFSTADVDEVQVALDRFSLFFPEKRDFFLQDAGIFEFGNLTTNGRPFFSRRIGLSTGGTPVKLNAGTKITGRVGRFNLGALAVQQEGTDTLDSKELFVMRASANVLEESALGFIMTHGDPLSDRTNTLYGADFFYRNRQGPFGGTLQGQVWAQHSVTPGLDDEQALGANLEYPNDRVNWKLGFLQIGSDFNPALGFTNRRGIEQYDGTLRYRTRPKSQRFREIDHEIMTTLVNGDDGERQTQILRLRPLRIATRSNDAIYVEWQQSKERVLQNFRLFGRLTIPANDYQFEHRRVELSTASQRPYRLVTSWQEGRFFGGRRVQKAADVQWRPSSHLYLKVGYTENDVKLPLGAFTSKLARLQTDIAFNPFWSWTTLVQYDNSADFLGGSSRLRYSPKDGQEVLLVVNSNFAIDEDDRYVNVRNDSLLKVSYTFRF